MQIFLDFLRRYNYIFLFVLLEVVSISILLSFNRYQGSVWLTAANDVAARVNGAYTGLESYFELGSLNSQLTAENIRLQEEIEALHEQLADAHLDSSFTAKRVAEQLAAYRRIPAKVVSNKVRRGSDNFLIIDRGSIDGIRPEMGVVSGGGVVGIVYLTSPHHALVLPVTNSKSSISCRVRGKEYFGYLQWDGRSTRLAHVDDIPRYAKARRGSVIETSGYSSVFPPGIFVGRVEKVSNSADGQSYRLDVVLGNDFGALRDVSVIATPYKPEIDSLSLKADSLSTMTN
ncbi:MAG: rod shape-determining protein MreC [Bacteroidaceae bacterium]|nr:rod shape-determining protein MreC [Bacteroidaceae bacterium]